MSTPKLLKENITRICYIIKHKLIVNEEKLSVNSRTLLEYDK